jgi:DNA-binding CsgD family transcriptional regulator
MRRGRDAEARAMLHDGIGTGERQRGNVLTLLAVARMGDRDDVPRARAVLERVADAPDELVERHALALFDAFVAHRDGRLDDAARLATPAADGFARLGFPLLEAAAAEVAGEVDRAVAIYRRCGAAGDLRRLRVVSAAATAPDAYRHRAARDPTLEQLTAREREIAALVADGHSNLEIAQRLAISHKTVEKHLGSAYAKLGVSSRVQLAACVAPLRRVADTG